MLNKTLLIAAAVVGLGAASLSAQAAPGDPLAGLVFGAAAGAAVGGPHGAAVGAVIGTFIGVAADADDRYYYGRGYDRYGRHDRGYYEPRYAERVDRRYVERSSYEAAPEERRYVERDYGPERVYQAPPRRVYYERAPVYYEPAPAYYAPPPSYYYAPAIIGAAIIGATAYRYGHHHRGHRHWRR